MSDEGALEPANDAVTSVDLLAAALRADATDLSTYERVLVGALSSALPEGMLEVVRERSLADRIAGRPGSVTSIRAHFGDVALELTSVRGALCGTVATAVRGVIISRREVDLAEWTRLFATELQRVAAEHATAREALQRFLSGS